MYGEYRIALVSKDYTMLLIYHQFIRQLIWVTDEFSAHQMLRYTEYAIENVENFSSGRILCPQLATASL